MRIIDLTNETIQFIRHITEYAREASPQKIRKDYADFTNPRGKYLERRTKFGAPAFAMEFAVLSFVEENYDSIDDFVTALTDKTVSDLETWLADAPKEGTSMADQVAWLTAVPSEDNFIKDLKDKVVDPDKLTEQRKEWDRFVNVSDSKDDLESTTIFKNERPETKFEEDLPGQTQESLWTLFNKLGELAKNETDPEAKSVLINRRQKIAFQLERDDPSLDAASRNFSNQNEVFAEVDAQSLLPMQDVVRPEGDDSDGSRSGGSGDPANQNKGSQLTDAAMDYISENFGSVQFFLQNDDLDITRNGVTKNVIEWIIEDQEENPDVIWSLFQQTKWFAENGPAARQFQSDWFRAKGTDDWFPNYDPSEGWLNMKPDMLELLDDTYDSLILEAERIGIDTNQVKVKNAVMGMAYNAKQLNMTDFEMKSEFLTNVNLAFDPNAVKGSGTFGAIRQKLQSNAATYMLKLDDASLDQFAQDIYLGKATYEGINAGFASSSKDMNPAIASLIDQGYTPSAYFASYGNVASNLLGRPVDFLGSDSKMFSALTDTMVSSDGLGRPMTRGEFERYVRATPEWDTSVNARDEAYSTVDTVLNSFGIRV